MSTTILKVIFRVRKIESSLTRFCFYFFNVHIRAKRAFLVFAGLKASLNFSQKLTVCHGGIVRCFSDLISG